MDELRRDSCSARFLELQAIGDSLLIGQLLATITDFCSTHDQRQQYHNPYFPSLVTVSIIARTKLGMPTNSHKPIKRLPSNVARRTLRLRRSSRLRNCRCASTGILRLRQDRPKANRKTKE